MRWTITCVLLTIVAVIAASEDDTRSKRDISFIKSLVATTLCGSEDKDPEEPPKIAVKQPVNYRLFRVPGFEKILVKAVPKIPTQTILEVPESDSVDVNPSVAIVNSYLGTEKLNDTLIALQGVKNLLQSGILDSQRDAHSAVAYEQGSYPSVFVESGKIASDNIPRPVVIDRADSYVPIYPAIEGYRSVEITRLPDMAIPTKYSYKQASGGGVRSYTANDNLNVLVTESKRPVPLPPYVTYRIQEALAYGSKVPLSSGMSVVAARVKPSPLPVPVLNAPAFPYPSMPIKAVPYVPYANDYKPQQPTPIPTQLAIEPSFTTNSGYTYNQVRNDGSVTTYSGAGPVIERKGAQPVPIPVFLTNRIEKAAAAAMDVRIPNAIPHTLYERPEPVYRVPYTVAVDGRPANYYDDHVSNFHYGINRPIYREDVNIHFAQHHNPHPAPSMATANAPSQYSYKHVHADGTVSTYTDSGVLEQQVNKEVRPGFDKIEKFYPANYYNNGFPQTHIVKEVICDEPPFLHLHAHNGVEHGYPQPAIDSSSNGGYTYQTGLGGLQTAYSGPGHVQQHNVPNQVNFSVPHHMPTVMVPELVSPQEFFEGDLDGPQKVMFAQPVVSQYVYKQINHNNPDQFVGDVGDVPLNGEVNVKVGERPAPVVTPRPYLSRPVTSLVVTAEPRPTAIHHPQPIRNVEIVRESAQSGFSYKQVTSSPMVSSTVNMVTSAPVFKVVKTSSSSSSFKKPSSSTRRPRPTPRVTTTAVPVTSAPTTQPSLSANPIVVLPAEEQTFSFKQDRADGSSITVIGDNKNVSVIEESKNEAHRGDIPDASY